MIGSILFGAPKPPPSTPPPQPPPPPPPVAEQPAPDSPAPPVSEPPPPQPAPADPAPPAPVAVDPAPTPAPAPIAAGGSDSRAVAYAVPPAEAVRPAAFVRISPMSDAVRQVTVAAAGGAGWFETFQRAERPALTEQAAAQAVERTRADIVRDASASLRAQAHHTQQSVIGVLGVR